MIKQKEVERRRVKHSMPSTASAVFPGHNLAEAQPLQRVADPDTGPVPDTAAVAVSPWGILLAAVPPPR